MISILKILTGGRGGSKFPKITLTSFVHGPICKICQKEKCRNLGIVFLCQQSVVQDQNLDEERYFRRLAAEFSVIVRVTERPYKFTTRPSHALLDGEGKRGKGPNVKTSHRRHYITLLL